MLSTISSQPIAGTYQDTKGRRIKKLEWQEETKPTTNWQDDLSGPTTSWQSDLEKPTTNWQEE